MKILLLTGACGKSMAAKDLGKTGWTIVQYGSEVITWDKAWVFRPWFSHNDLFQSIEFALMTEKSDRLVLYTEGTLADIAPVVDRLSSSLSHGLAIIMVNP